VSAPFTEARRAAQRANAIRMHATRNKFLYGAKKHRDGLKKEDIYLAARRLTALDIFREVRRNA
jgi:hypothetical protein